jgi:Adenylate and Guanylate cyclase catalytic domain
MAVFGAPVALEDHAIRACTAALGVQDEAKRVAVAVQDRDGVDLLLQVGLNSVQVIAGEIGSGPFGYTTIGEQVGMAQRMKSVAPPGWVMLSASTARPPNTAQPRSKPGGLIQGNSCANRRITGRPAWPRSGRRWRLRRARSGCRHTLGRRWQHAWPPARWAGSRTRGPLSGPLADELGSSGGWDRDRRP